MYMYLLQLRFYQKYLKHFIEPIKFTLHVHSLYIFENCNYRHPDSPLYYIICTTVDRIDLHIM